MGTLKLQIVKSGRVNPVTRKKGLSARVKTNGTAAFDDIVKEAGHNTTMHKAELRMAFELCIDSVTEMLKQGFIVDLGPLGKIYPSCSSSWYEKEEDMKLSDVKPQLYYRAGEEVEAAIKSAKLVWAKGSEDEEEEEGSGTPSGRDEPGGGDEPGGDTPTPTPNPSGGGDSHED
jgi:hypothetical protein